MRVGMFGMMLGSLAAVGSAIAGTPALPAGLRLTEVEGGFSGLTGIYQPNDGTQRLFAIEQSGRVKIVQSGTTLGTNFLRLCGSGGGDCFVPPGGFTSGGERGLLGLAFHPQFSSNRQVFVHYSDAQGDTAIGRVLASAGNPGLADTATFTRLMEVSQDFSNHNGGQILFGPDGYLYIALGDGGSGNDPCSRAQTIDPALLCNGVSNDGQTGCPSNSSCGPASRGPSRALLGKMLRIDVDATTPAGGNRLCAAAANGSAPYAVPNDNPYAESGDDPGCGEVWLTGLRNPWRFSFDRDTDDMFIGDVGQDTREEIDLLPASSTGGENFGWRCREGLIANISGAPVCNAPPAFVDPIFDVPQSGGVCSITGGYRYRGPAQTLDGLYFFGDYCQGRVRVAVDGGGSWSESIWTPFIGNIRTFGEGVNGEVYVGSDDTIYLISGYASADVVHQHGFEDTVVP